MTAAPSSGAVDFALAVNGVEALEFTDAEHTPNINGTHVAVRFSGGGGK